MAATVSADGPGTFAPPESDNLVALTFGDAIAEIALNGGPLNLVTRGLLRQLSQALSTVAIRDDIRCLILHGGSARAFCAGSDIKEFDTLRQDASEHKILFEDMVLRKLADTAMPTIAAIDGPAFGGGLELALACDLRVIRRGIQLGLTESQLGGLAGNGAIRLTRIIGPARAKELLFTGEPISADKALEWGIVNRVVDGSALTGARELAATIGRRGPLSNRLAKQLANAAHDMALGAGLSMSTAFQQRIFESADLYEGVAAFFEKRPPQFKGR